MTHAMRDHRQRRIGAGCVAVAGGCEYDDVSDQRPSPAAWALAGFGSGGRIFHAPLIASEPGLELVAVVTSDAERRAAVAERYPQAVCVADVTELPALGVVGVTISTPPATHAPLALAAIGLGLHVVVDKPFARTVDEALTIADAAARAGVLAIPYFNRRWDDDFRTVVKLAADGRLGTIHRFESRIDRCRPVKPGWPSDISAGGGVLLDLGPHLIDQALRLLGPAATVYARMDTRRDGARAEDSVILDLTHTGGARSTLIASLAAPAAGPRFVVQGSAGGVRIEGFDVQEAQLKSGGSPAGLGDRWGAEPTRTAAFTDRGGAAVEIPLERGRWDLFYRSVAAAVTDGDAPPVGPPDAVATARVIDAARVSARTDQVVSIGVDAPTG